MSDRHLIVNADDLGQTAGVNRAFGMLHKLGIVTSASLMVRFPAARGAARYARRYPEISVGLHLDLGEWACRAGVWHPVYEVVPWHDRAAVEAEVNRQLLQYRQLMGSDPTHLDSHQHVHRHEPVRTILRDIAQSLSVPLREHCPAIRYCGSFYGQGVDGTPYPEAITVDNLVALVRGTQSGFTELGCHPGVNEAGHAMYRAERAVETAVLSDGRVRAAIEEERITLTSFHTVPVP